MAAATKQKASSCWRQLNGLLCVFKPPDITLGKLIANLRLIIPAGLNKMIIRPPRKLIQYDASLGVPLITEETDYSDHPLVIGPRYDMSDVRCYCASPLGIYSSGVCVIGLNSGKVLARDLEDSRPLRKYRLVGELGIGTDTLSIRGKVVERASISRIFRPQIDKVVAAMQASHQRSMYLNSGVHLQSQTAYDLAVKGLIRPANNNVPVMYGIQCVEFEKPYFTVEVTCLNETEEFLLNIVHMIGIRSHSVARCNSLKCIRYGPFNLDHALLRHSWTVENFVSNINMCNAINERDLKSGRRENLQFTPLEGNSDIDTHQMNESQTVEPPELLSRHQRRRRLAALQSKENAEH